MYLTRFYHKRQIDSGHIRGIRDVLSTSFNWGFAYANYCLYYSSEFYSLDKINEVDKVVAEKGQPKDVRVAFTSQGGRTLIIQWKLVNQAESRSPLTTKKIHRPEFSTQSNLFCHWSPLVRCRGSNQFQALLLPMPLTKMVIDMPTKLPAFFSSSAFAANLGERFHQPRYQTK